MERAQLSAARLEKGWTLEAAAERLQVDRMTLRRWEKGITTPQPLNLRRLIHVYQKTTHELGLGGIHDEAQPHPEVSRAMVPSIPSFVATEAHSSSLLTTSDEVYRTFLTSNLTLRLIGIVWRFPYQHARYHELQRVLILELEDNTMKGDSISRRDALRFLAAMPIEMCGLSQFATTAKRPNEEIIAQCTAGITACWYLRKGKDLAFASSIVSQYLPTLQAIVQSASGQLRKDTAELLVQGLVLQAALVRHVDGDNVASLRYAQQAEVYSEIADNPLLTVLSLRTQASCYDYANHWEQAMHAAEKAAHYLETTRNQPFIPMMQSFLYSGLSNYQAHNGKKQEALISLHKAHATFFAQPPDQPVPIWLDHEQTNLLLNDGLTHYHLGLQKQALDSFAQIQALETTTETRRVEALLDQVMAEVNREDHVRDMEWCIHMWTQGMESTQVLKSEPRYEEAVLAYTVMRGAWPGEQRIKQLRDYIVHW